MIFALVATNLTLAAFAAFLLRTLVAERAAQRTREDELMNRIQAPQIAVAHSLPYTEGTTPYVSAFDDEALAEYEDLRRQMVVPKDAE